MGKRRNDLIVSFDEESRKDFILGFQKRKKQRRELALKKLVQRQAELRHQDRVRLWRSKLQVTLVDDTSETELEVLHPRELLTLPDPVQGRARPCGEGGAS